MPRSELHAQAGVWPYHDNGLPVLFMEGEAVDPANGGAPVEDALYRVALASGLRLTTDLDHLAPEPVPGWRLLLDQAGRLTLSWPRFNPLLDNVSMDLPPGWLRLATGYGMVEVFVGHHLGLHEHARDGQAHPSALLERAAESGALAAGAVPVTIHNGR
jgi:hypothetical protein